MAIKYRYQCLTGTLNSTKTVTLKPKEDESIHITDIRIGAITLNTPVCLDVAIDRHRVGRMLIGRPYQITSALHNGVESAGTGGYNLDPGLADYKTDYIVANGEEITFSVIQGSFHIEVEYDIYDRDDLQATMPGGSKHGTYYYVAEYNATVTHANQTGSATVELLPDSNIPDQFLEPIKGNIGLNQRVECLGIGALPIVSLSPDGTRSISSERLIITKNREVLGNKDGDGVALIAMPGTSSSTTSVAKLNDFPLFPMYPNKTDVFDEMKVIKSGDKYKFAIQYLVNTTTTMSTIFRIFVFWKITQ